MDKMIPECKYEVCICIPARALKFAEEHDEDAWGCHNTDAHLRSSIIGRSETVVIENGELDLGEFGFIYFIDFDNTRARQRTVQVLVMGE